MLAVTLDSMLIPRQEIQEAQRIARFLGTNHKIVTVNPLEIPGVRKNPPERCYYCKRYLSGRFVTWPAKRVIRLFWMALLRMIRVTHWARIEGIDGIRNTQPSSG